MQKAPWESKAVQGVVLAVLGYLWGLWTGETQTSQTVVAAGLGWAGFGLRSAMK